MVDTGKILDTPKPPIRPARAPQLTAQGMVPPPTGPPLRTCIRDARPDRWEPRERNAERTDPHPLAVRALHLRLALHQALITAGVRRHLPRLRLQGQIPQGTVKWGTRYPCDLTDFFFSIKNFFFGTSYASKL